MNLSFLSILSIKKVSHFEDTSPSCCYSREFEISLFLNKGVFLHLSCYFVQHYERKFHFQNFVTFRPRTRKGVGERGKSEKFYRTLGEKHLHLFSSEGNVTSRIEWSSKFARIVHPPLSSIPINNAC